MDPSKKKKIDIFHPERTISTALHVYMQRVAEIWYITGSKSRLSPAFVILGMLLYQLLLMILKALIRLMSLYDAGDES